MLNRRLKEAVDKLERRVAELERNDRSTADLADEVELLKRMVANFELDYHNLYEKVRTNLAKLRKRAENGSEASPPADPLADARKALAARKLKGA